MKVVNIGEKVINIEKVHRVIDRIFEMRSRGHSQQEIALKFNTDRTFISRLESLGEVRRGGNIAVIGFPIGNKAEIERLLDKHGVGFKLLLSEKERWDFVLGLSGPELVNRVMDLIAEVRSYDIVIFLGSDKRSEIIEGILDNDVITVNIGPSPLTQDVYVEPSVIEELLNSIK